MANKIKFFTIATNDYSKYAFDYFDISIIIDRYLNIISKFKDLYK